MRTTNLILASSSAPARWPVTCGTCRALGSPPLAQPAILLGMTVIETIIQGVQGLTLREQVDVARYVHRLNPTAQKEREEVLRRTYGALSEADGVAFEQAMENARRVETHGQP